VLNRLLKVVGEVREFFNALLEELGNLALEIGLAAEGNLLALVGADQSEWRFALLVASEAQSVADHHLANEVILCVLDHTQSHDM